MGHHKRKRPKNRRAGCLMCKPWKVNGVGKSGNLGDLPEKCSDFKNRAITEQDIDDFFNDCYDDEEYE